MRDFLFSSGYGASSKRVGKLLMLAVYAAEFGNYSKIVADFYVPFQ